MPDADRLRWHEDRDTFRDLLILTSARTGFLARLVEKDYFCSVLLQYLAASCPGLVFKGGTCLAKVHAEFHRMSEDLDFTIPVPVASARSARSRLAEDLKRAIGQIESRLSGFHTVTAVRGANNSTQYNAAVTYPSCVGQHVEEIKIETGLREPLLMPVVLGEARTLLLGPGSDLPLVPALSIPCLSMAESIAEKVRAALSRREPAVRDFYDVDHAVRTRSLRLEDPAFLALVQRKFDLPQSPAVDLSPPRFAALKSQVDTDLKPVLRPLDFASFDLERAFATVVGVARAIGRTP